MNHCTIPIPLRYVIFTQRIKIDMCQLQPPLYMNVYLFIFWLITLLIILAKDWINWWHGRQIYVYICVWCWYNKCLKCTYTIISTIRFVCSSHDKYANMSSPFVHVIRFQDKFLMIIPYFYEVRFQKYTVFTSTW